MDILGSRPARIHHHFEIADPPLHPGREPGEVGIGSRAEFEPTLGDPFVRRRRKFDIDLPVGARALRRSSGLPWQRVLGAGGEIKLRGDSAIEQRLRLESEGVRFRGRKVDMKACEWNGKKRRR